ncbi:MAG: 30S ribosomal protein S27ae [Candidatus Bathyarchaeia archaeon]
MSEKAEKKSKKTRPSLSTLYDYDYEKKNIKLKNRKCPRCANIMAHHTKTKQRWTCGSCNFTDYIKSQS